MESTDAIKVAVRIRPQVPKELIEGCNVCTDVTPNEPQVWLGKDKAFTFDHVYDIPAQQQQIYESSVRDLIEGCFDGFNATVLAYGQTGSGKTFTMGTGLDIGGNPRDRGIIPRAVDHLFEGIKQRQQQARLAGRPLVQFQVHAQFLELYNEEIIDLLADERAPRGDMKIREDRSGDMYITGATTKSITSVEESLACLKSGALSRTTGATQMNAQSSRSHAIFTLHIKQLRVVEPMDVTVSDETQANGDNDSNKENDESATMDGAVPAATDLREPEFETLTAKFHFVDLAGSERLKRTGATGDRAKEGIAINCGLLALGNVISALGDRSKKAQHVPYRDSKLTRLLQDSLGGNSRTLMIACISPSDRDFMETLNTLHYANRAKNIKNRVVANQDKSSQTISALRRRINELEVELAEYKQGKRVVLEGQEHVNDMHHENKMLLEEISSLRTRVKALQESNSRLSERNAQLLTEKALAGWAGGENCEMSDLVTKYLAEIEELRGKLIEQDAECTLLRKQAQRSRMAASPYGNNLVALTGPYDIREEGDLSSADIVLQQAKKEVARQRKEAGLPRDLFNAHNDNDTNGNEVDEMNGGGEENGTENKSSSSASDSDDVEEMAEAVSKAELELLALTNEISTKEKLIIELERSQRKISSLKQHYEDKLVMLQDKINSIESERDKVLAKLSSSAGSNEKSSRVREEYQKKLNTVQAEMKKLQAAKQKHEKTLRDQVQYEAQLKKLRSDVSEMKKAKVRLVTQMKEEQQRHRAADMRNHKMIAQLSKQDRQKEIRIKNLESEQNNVKKLLKRKDDEINALKRRPVKSMSDKVAGRISAPPQSMPPPVLPFSEKSSKQRWHTLESNINKLIISNQNIRKQEQAMDAYMKEREQNNKSLEKARRQLRQSRIARDEQTVSQLTDEIETLEAHLKYLNSSIQECQSAIVQLEETKEDCQGEDLMSFIQMSGPNEIKYIFDKVLMMAISKSMDALQLEAEKKEWELKYKHLHQSSNIQEELLHHVLETTFVSGPYYDDITFASEEAINDVEMRPPTNGMPIKSTAPARDGLRPPPSPSNRRKSEKARRLTKTPQELLYETIMSEDPSEATPPHSPAIARKHRDREDNVFVRLSSSTPCANFSNHHHAREITEATPPTSPSVTRKHRDREDNVFVRLTSSTSGSNFANHHAREISEATPPSSPSANRKHRDREDNVFVRLTSSTSGANFSNHRPGMLPLLYRSRSCCPRKVNP